MIAAVTAAELELVVFAAGLVVLLAAALVAYRGRLAEAGVIALIGLLLVLLAG